MSTVTKRELNQRTAVVLDQVTETDDVVVTERGTPRWRVSAFRDHSSRLARLEREGRYSPPSPDPTPWPSLPGGRPYTNAQVEALLGEMSGDH
ncbi:type II toxin-antitoxin system prevent-host-death family antitoxin [Mycobacterium sp. M1]|uniref:Type II toxin-antitoxin system prevent-host-death family antitoxin n=1 Tax=Mycolicibacter acidiphilus TaxID=2835306 RepID=A0ABS5RK82_9MYCO|nr:type II toxin-antitoxin system prevent-host-death family antitoxin [Mycolicibacter acidiphilus]MBS9534697.1 type II toxin-antitoxin system prevent-host-death family antitoxin [Mycolicibacter acidiphilus]